MKSIFRYWQKCRGVGASPFLVAFGYFLFKLRGKSILAHPSSLIKGWNNLDVEDGLLQIGMSYVGFTHRQDVALLNIRGKMRVCGSVSIGRGCRVDIGSKGLVSIGAGSYINANTKLVVMHELIIGEGCAISWDCEFLDEDFHEISYPGRRTKASPGIRIGNSCWIGAGVRVLSGAVIPDGCVVAAGSVVTKTFDEPCCLLAGNPAKIIKKEVSWS